MWFLSRLNGSDCWPTVREGHVSMMKPIAAKPRTRLNTDPLRNILFNLTQVAILANWQLTGLHRSLGTRGASLRNWSRGGSAASRIAIAATARLEFCVHPGATAKPGLFLPSMPSAFFTIGARRARTGNLCVAPGRIVGSAIAGH